MGWTGIPIDDRTDKELLASQFNGDLVNFMTGEKTGTHRIVDMSRQGNTYYLAVEFARKDIIYTSAVVVLTRKENDYFYYKDISEDMGPVYHGIARRVLEKLSPLDHFMKKDSQCYEYADKWRLECLRQLQNKPKAIKPGDIVYMPNYQCKYNYFQACKIGNRTRFYPIWNEEILPYPYKLQGWSKQNYKIMTMDQYKRGAIK